ncbi:MAG: hypothetical protein MZV70_69005 [Desulfobacterales bacterium]|nr:hypothetical protein [Desulfobacterales bacterium]
MKIITAVRGFKDILPGEVGKVAVRSSGKARDIFGNFGFREIRHSRSWRRRSSSSARIGEDDGHRREGDVHLRRPRGRDPRRCGPRRRPRSCGPTSSTSLYASEALVKLLSRSVPCSAASGRRKAASASSTSSTRSCFGVDRPARGRRGHPACCVTLSAQRRRRGCAASTINSLGCPACRPPSGRCSRRTWRGRSERPLRGLPAADCRRNPLRVLRLQGAGLPGDRCHGAPARSELSVR